MAEMCAEFLDTDWARNLRKQIGELRQGDRPFSKFVNELLQLNSILLGLPMHMNDTLLHYHLESNINDDLKDKLSNTDIDNTITFKA